MFLYQCQLAWRSMCKTPVLCGLVVLVLAVGVAVAMITYTSLYAVNKNYLAYKDDSLFMVRTDSWKEKDPEGNNHMLDPLSYRDTVALLKSAIPWRKAVSTITGGTMSMPNKGVKPMLMRGRVASHDFFAMFDIGFIYGAPWDQSADTEPQDVIVLTEETNQRLFNGKNSVGERVLFEGNLYQVAGVVQNLSGINLRDIDMGVMAPNEQFYLPFGLLAVREISRWRPVFCPESVRDYGVGYAALLTGGCLWIVNWVEFTNEQQKQAYKNFLTNYVAEQKRLGFYTEPVLVELTNITEKMKINGKYLTTQELVFYFGIGFLVVCILNCIAMLLAKFMKALPESGVRRALGATRVNIFSQHLIESGLIGLLGSALGVCFTYLSLAILRRAYTPGASLNGVSEVNFSLSFQPDAIIFLLTILTGVIASLCAGLYPSWRICQSPSAQYLKLQ